MQITSGFKLKPHKQGKTLLECLRFPARGYQNRGKNRKYRLMILNANYLNPITVTS